MLSWLSWCVRVGYRHCCCNCRAIPLHVEISFDVVQSHVALCYVVKLGILALCWCQHALFLPLLLTGGHIQHHSPFISPGSPGSVFFPPSPYLPLARDPAASAQAKGRRRQTLATTGVSIQSDTEPAKDLMLPVSGEASPVAKRRKSSWLPWLPAAARDSEKKEVDEERGVHMVMTMHLLYAVFGMVWGGANQLGGVSRPNWLQVCMMET